MNEHTSSAQSPEQPLSASNIIRESVLPGEYSGLPGRADLSSRISSTPSRVWWHTAWIARATLLLILLLGAYFRLIGITTWDGGTGQHPDERFFTDVTSLVRVPSSISEYFDSARSPANPRNVGRTFFVYGTWPILVTRVVAVMLTPDEALPQMVANSSTEAGDPPQLPNPERAIPKLAFLQQMFNPEGNNLTEYGRVNNVGRAVVVLFDLGSILLVYMIACRLYDRRVALLAALLSALAVMSIQQSHFYVDPIFSTFCALLTLYWSVRIAQGGGIGSFVAVGFSIGLATASRVTLAALGLIACVAAVQAALVWSESTRSQRALTNNGRTSAAFLFMDNFLLRSLPLLVLAGVLALLTFRATQPYAFIGSTPTSPEIPSEHPSSLDLMQGWGFFDLRPDPRFLDNMRTVQRLVTGEDEFPPSLQWVNRTAYLFPWKNMVLWGMGPALGLTVWLAWAVAGWLLLQRLLAVLRGKETAPTLAALVLWVWISVYFAWQGAQFASTMRYMLPIYGSLIILGAWLLIALYDKVVERRLAIDDRARWLFILRRATAASGPWLLLLVVLGTFAWAYAFTRIYTRPHSRVMAAEWMMLHAPPGSKITAEQWDDPLPMNAVRGGDPWSTTYQGVSMSPYAEDDPQKYTGDGQNPGLVDQLVEADYVVLSSNRVYDSISRLPMRYPVLMRYYHYLFTGELGFDLVADVASYPTLFGIRIPDYRAEEAFTVYDHPRVLIFQKTPAFSRERVQKLLVENANWNEVYKSPVLIAERSTTALRLTPGEWSIYRAGGTWAELFNRQSFINHDIIAPLVWLLMVELLGFAMFALLFRLLPWLPDRGFTLGRVLGLLLVAYAAWLLGSLHVLPFTTGTVWLCALPLLISGAWVAWHAREALHTFWTERRTALLTVQTLYLGAFLLLLVVRWLNPDLWHPARGGEKPMEFAYLNAVLKSAAFPPYDPWFAGGYINYYYFGFVIVGTLIHLTTIVPGVAYNLAVPTLFALTVVGAWGVVYNLLSPRGRRLAAGVKRQLADRSEGHAEAGGEEHAEAGGEEHYDSSPPRHTSSLVPQGWTALEARARFSALLAPLFVAILGNLAQAIWFVNGYAAMQSGRSEWAFWDATRIVDGTVNEFPFFTFLFADLHAHMIVIPFSLAVLGLLVALVRRCSQASSVKRYASSPLAHYAPFVTILLLLGLLAGTLRATNTWDYPTFVGLTVVTVILLGWRQFQQEWQAAGVGLNSALDDASEEAPSSSWAVNLPAAEHPEHIDEPMPLWLLAGRRVLLTLGQIVLIIGVGNLLFLPFTSHFATESSGVELLTNGLKEHWLDQIWYAERTSLWDLLRMYGLWLFVLLSAGVLLVGRSVRVPALLRNSAFLFILGLLAGGIGVWLSNQKETGGLSAPALLIPMVLGAGWIAWNMRSLPLRMLMPVLWTGLALALCLGVDLFVVRGDVGRMNTVFKFGMHAWILFGLTAAVIVPWMMQQMSNLPLVSHAWTAVTALLIAASLAYPLTATPARIGDRYAEGLPHTLDGTEFMRHVNGNEQGRDFPLREDYAAIAWMQHNIKGTPMILEAHLPSYRWAGRVATYTGLPTLLGWEWHQIQQRMAANSGTVINNRQNMIAQIFNDTDPAKSLRQLRLYGIEYVYVGGVERAIYNPNGVAKFDILRQQGQLEEVYSDGDTQIYRVQDPGEPTVLATDISVVPGTIRTPPPLLLDEPVNRLPVVGDYAWNRQASANPWTALLTWMIALYVLLLLGLPVSVVIFGRWYDGGVVWARLIALLVLGYAVWFPTSYGVWHYDLWGLAGGALLVLGLNAGLIFWLGRHREQKAETPDPGPQTPDPSPQPPEQKGENGEPRTESPDTPLSTPDLQLLDPLETGQNTVVSSFIPVRSSFSRHPFIAGLVVIGNQLKSHRRNILLSEGLFLLAFLVFTGLRALNPDLWHPVWGGEKPMEFGFLNAILRSPVMPPYDPFFSNGYINYYYYGIYLASVLIKATGLAPALAYNMVIPTVFALTLTGGFAVVRQLTGQVRYGLIGAAFLTILGNLASVIPAGWSRGLPAISEGIQEVGITSLGDLGAWLGDWYVGPSRVIPHTINEFPYWTFLFADLHPHMIALPITVLVIALVYQVVCQHREPRPELQAPMLPDDVSSSGIPSSWSQAALYMLTALTLGALAVTNSWDFPTYALLMGAASVGATWRSYRGRGIPWLSLLRAGGLALLVAVGGLALYMPFFDHFYAMVSGIGLVREGTDIRDYLLLYGLFLAVLIPVVLSVSGRIVAVESRRRKLAPRIITGLIVGFCLVLPAILVALAVWWPVFGLSIWLGMLIVYGLFLFVQRRLATATWFILGLALLGWAVSLGIEIIFIRDHLAIGDFYRMNTVFKFGLQIWTLLALAAAAGMPLLLHAPGRTGRRLGIGRVPAQAVGLLLIGMLIAATAVFTVFGTASRLANRFSTELAPTLDGLAFLQVATFDYDCQSFPGCEPGMGMERIDLRPDAAAIAWLNATRQGTPIVAQANTWFYRGYGIRVAANTGLPTMISALHVDEQRDSTRSDRHNADLDRLFRTTDRETTLRILATYGVNYIYVGAVEHALYNAAGLQKFEQMVGTYLDKVYDLAGVAIYQVKGIPVAYGEPPVYNFAAEETEVATPPPPDEQGNSASEDNPDVAPAPASSNTQLTSEIASLEQQLADNPTSGPLAYGLGERYRAVGRIDDALRVMAVGATSNPSDVGLHHLWGDTLSQAGRFEEAERVYRGIAETLPTAGNWNKLGVGLLQWGKLDDAEAALLRAISVDPSVPEPYFRLGQVYQQQGKREQSIQNIEMYLRLAPDGYLGADARRVLESLQQ